MEKSWEKYKELPDSQIANIYPDSPVTNILLHLLFHSHCLYRHSIFFVPKSSKN